MTKVRRRSSDTQSTESGPEPDLLQTGARNHRAPVSADRPALRLRAKMASDASTRYRHKVRQSERQRVKSSPADDCSEGNINYTTKGTFYIVGQLQANIPKADFQSDSAASVQAEEGQTTMSSQWLSSSEESWQKLQPVVECGDDAMYLIVRRRRAGNLQLHQLNGSSVPLSQLPPQCGYSVQATWRDLSLMVQYDACHVTQEDDGYVLPLLWRGTPVKMSCPVTETHPPATGPFSVCCLPYIMTVKLQGLSPPEVLKINVRGEWKPLVLFVEQCGYTLERRGSDAVISAPYLTCGMTVKDEKYTLYLQVGEKTLTLSCPVSRPEANLLSREPKDSIPNRQTAESFPWAAPFYLAPLYYPHPTDQKPSVHGVDDPLTTSPSMPDLTLATQPLGDPQPEYPQYHYHPIPIGELYKQYSLHTTPSSPSREEDSSLVHPDQEKGIHVSGLSKKHSATDSSFSATGSAQAEAPSVQPPRHAFNPYYHYYHHPKIPLFDPRRDPDPDPGPEVPEKLYSMNPRTFEFPVLPPKIQPSDTNSDQVSESEAAPHNYISELRPEVDSPPYAPHPPHIPYHDFYYFPHGEAKTLASAHHDMAAEMNVSLSHSSALPIDNKYDVYPDTDRPNSDETMINSVKYTSDQVENPPLPEDDGTKSELGDKASHSAATPSYSPTPDPVVVPPAQSPSSYLFYDHPYSHYYQIYYAPGYLPSADNPESPSSSSSSVQHPSSHKPQTTNSPSESTSDVGNGQLPLYFYNYHPLYEQEVSKDDQGRRPTGSIDSEKASSKSASLPPSDPDVAGHPSIPQRAHSPLYSLYSHYVTQQHPYDPFGHPGAEEAGEWLDNDTRGDIAPPALPCGLGPVLDFYTVKDCTMGQYFVFVAPESVLEPTLALHSSEDSTASCTLQKLTAESDLYITPLECCGVNKYVFGQTVVYLLEVQGVLSPQQDNSSGYEISPVRLMVECSSSSGSPGEVKIHVMDRPPLPPVQPTPAMVTVQLRLATDESFTHYHPEAQLPLSLIQGRLLYLEVSLLDPPEADLVLLVHSCLAYVQAPYTGWMPIYDGCTGWYDSQPLPSPDPHHIWRILISSFLFLPPESTSYVYEGGHTPPDDPQIYFWCSTEVCSAADGDCINRPDSDV
ncbi:hypothetical protein JOB18_012047 [Solea senegalensis]|nr:hypothetical protein JOB18_012047 [Solea senegalensis]